MGDGTPTHSARSVKKFTLLFVKLVVVAALTYLAVSGVEIETLIAALGRVPTFGFVLALVLQCVTLAISALRWHICLAIVGLPIPLAAATRIFFVSNFLGTALPTGIGQDVLRIYSAAKTDDLDTGRLAKSTASVVLDRFAGLMAFGVLGMPALVLILKPAPGLASICGAQLDWLPSFDGALLALALICAVVSGVALLLAGLRSVGRTLKTAWNLVGHHSGQLAAITALSALIVALVAMVVYVLGAWLTPATPLSEYLLLVPLIALLAQLPLSILGLGVREAGFVLLFACETAGREEALALSIAYFSVGVLANLVGALAYLAPSTQKG